LLWSAVYEIVITTPRLVVKSWKQEIETMKNNW